MNKFKDFDDTELRKLLYIAQETRNLRYYRAIKAEISRRAVND